MSPRIILSIGALGFPCYWLSGCASGICQPTSDPCVRALLGCALDAVFARSFNPPRQNEYSNGRTHL